MTGSRFPPHWSERTPDLDLWDLKGVLEEIVLGSRLGNVTVREEAPEASDLAPEEGFTVLGPEEILGAGGRIRGDRVDAPAWAGTVWAAEIRLPAEPGGRPVPTFQPLPPFPGVDRDLAFLLPKELPARQVEERIRDAAGPLLAGVTVFDLYEGKGIPQGLRSVAFRLRFQSSERTLTDEDVDGAVGAVTDRLREELGVHTRG
jgi:phenylalanyl-tRNA synthetase beta chain